MECDSEIYIAASDPFDCAEIRCSLEKGHSGKHESKFTVKDQNGNLQQVSVTWEKSEYKGR